MSLSEEDQEKILGWIKQHSKQEVPPNCPICQHREWDVYNSLYALKEVEKKKGQLHTKDAEVPRAQRAKILIAISCQNCGQTTLFDAEKIGVI